MAELVTSSPSTAPDAAPVAQTEPASGAASQPRPSPSPSSQSGPASSQGADVSSQPAAPPGFRDLLSKFGAGDVASQFKDDEALAHHFLQTRQQLERASELARYGEQVQPYWSEFQKFKAQQDQAAQQAALQQSQAPWWKEYWNPPEFDPSWEKQIVKDHQGNLVPAAGAPPDVVQKYNQYLQFRNQQADKLMRNPFEFFEKPILALAQRVAQQVVQQQFGQQQQNQFAEQFVAQNTNWLFKHNVDPTGQVLGPVLDPQTGKQVLSEDGQVYRDAVIRAQQLGIRDVAGQHEFAIEKTQNRYRARHGQTSAAPVTDPGAAVKQQFLAGAMRPNSSGSVQPPNGNGITPAQNQSLPLSERLRRGMAAAGVTDKDVQ